MKIYVALLASGFALLQLAINGEPGASVLEQRTQSFAIALNGSIADVTPLFGPVREAEWAPGWSPRFIHPAWGAQEEGAVFITRSDHNKDRLWLLTDYDVREGRIEYVVVTTAFTATDIKIRVVPDGQEHCKATITYRRSALTPEGNEEVDDLDAHWAKEQQIHWEGAINDALEKERRS